jgi:hypothetical protein
VIIDDPVAPAEEVRPAATAEEIPPRVETRAPRSHQVWTAFLALAVLVTAGGLTLLYNNALGLQSANRAMTIDNESLQGRNIGLQGQLTAIQGTLTAAQADLARARADLAHPVLAIWNVSQVLPNPNYRLAAGIPDTFTYHLHLSSTGPMNVSILSLDGFAQAITCVQNGVGNTDYCMHHSSPTNSWLGVTSVKFDFHEAEGCAGYILVITSPRKVTVTPDVSVTYNPAPHATGTCS